jgi:hypothetical protein
MHKQRNPSMMHNFICLFSIYLKEICLINKSHKQNDSFIISQIARVIDTIYYGLQTTYINWGWVILSLYMIVNALLSILVDRTKQSILGIKV